MNLPEGYSFIGIEGHFIRNDKDARDNDQTQYWIHLDPEETESQIAEEHEEESNSDKRKEWCEAETLLLIDIVNKYKLKLTDPRIKKKTLFDTISCDMNIQSKGEFIITSAQPENEWKSLAKKFKDIKDHNNKTGNAPKAWKYHQMISEIIGDRPNVEPKAGCSSIQLSNTSNKKQKEPQDTSTKEQGVKKKSSKEGGSKSDLLSFLKTHENNLERREKEKLDLLKSQHEELKSFMETILKNLNDKES
ncbi:unnamed protein product [Phaedon cochleariae]|uniref:Myb/SANT-like DNA-binding domain-containing protein n=1 Tax=Phaedon cochleariae TaxID=80249 RepID=A0A9N9SF52_PHACE|nr:unnamed protein product [Phaedon cochleariae]